MDAQVATHEHAHPGPALYLRVAVILFVMTALEVLAFEVSHRPSMPLHELVQPLLNEILIILSAAKFALVAMFYMHLKQDSKIFSGLFVFPLIIAAVLIVALLLLFSYLRLLHPAA
ncbi:MAG TPA: cytochrome C oxidase subunit IV family protein [Gemmatimonadales bacterium]|nr:cytochrome C oxidase subunit IV family protein [Gemmatimonadales bacterium]HRZ09654.1 cytochrome C oxidase subunit IV family protein [Gemmatimonadales bacterium]